MHCLRKMVFYEERSGSVKERHIPNQENQGSDHMLLGRTLDKRAQFT